MLRNQDKFPTFITTQHERTKKTDGQKDVQHLTVMLHLTMQCITQWKLKCNGKHFKNSKHSKITVNEYAVILLFVDTSWLCTLWFNQPNLNKKYIH